MDDQTKTSGKSPLLIIGIIALVVILGGAYFLSRNNSQPTEVKSSPTTEPAMQSNVKSFTVEASNFTFSLKEIKVKKGDKVKIHLVNNGGFHDWVLDEFNAKTDQIQSDKTADVEFTADKVGSFEYYCSVANHREMGMRGSLIVE